MKTVCDDVNSEKLALSHVQWLALVLAILKFQVLLLFTCSGEMVGEEGGM